MSHAKARNVPPKAVTYVAAVSLVKARNQDFGNILGYIRLCLEKETLPKRVN